MAILLGPLCFSFTSKRFSVFTVYVEGLTEGLVHKCSLIEFSQIIKLNKYYGFPCGTCNICHNYCSQGTGNLVEERLFKGTEYQYAMLCIVDTIGT